ncbi:MAG: outer membrane lipoprotein carrier protein LolA [Verrucomicrobiota bacterium]
MSSLFRAPGMVLPLLVGFWHASLFVGWGEEELDLEPVQRWLAAQQKVEALEVRFQQERKLRTLRKPLLTEGTFWFAQPDRFRWELGIPARTVALLTAEGEFIVADFRKKTFERTRKEEIQVKQGSFSSYFELAFPRDWEAFQSQFAILSLTENDEGGEEELALEVRPRERKPGVEGITFYLTRDGQSRGFAFTLEDGSKLGTRFLEITEKKRLPEETWMVELGELTEVESLR